MNPAPTLSPTVIDLTLLLESVFFAPVLGSLVLLPPVVDVTGPEFAKLIRLAIIASLALICSSMPDSPSHFPAYHWIPQMFPLPEHDFAAAVADFWSLGMIVLYVEGTSKTVNDSHDEVTPLNKISLLLHCLLLSQVTSSKMPPFELGKNLVSRTSSRPSTTVNHLDCASFSVYSITVELVSYAGMKCGINWRQMTYVVVHISGSHEIGSVII